MRAWSRARLEKVIAESIEKHYFPVGAHCPLDKKINIYGIALANLITEDVATFLSVKKSREKQVRLPRH